MENISIIILAFSAGICVTLFVSFVTIKFKTLSMQIQELRTKMPDEKALIHKILTSKIPLGDLPKETVDEIKRGLIQPVEQKDRIPYAH